MESLFTKGMIVKAWGIRYRVLSVYDNGMLHCREIGDRSDLRSIDLYPHECTSPNIQHYGFARMVPGSILNWRGIKYIVLNVVHHESLPDGCKVTNNGHRRSTYILRTMRGTKRYSAYHADGYITRPKAIKDTGEL